MEEESETKATLVSMISLSLWGFSNFQTIPILKSSTQYMNH